MKALKWGLYVIVGITITVLVTALFVKNEYGAERSIIIDKPKEKF